jgi:hypothetical protein
MRRHTVAIVVKMETLDIYDTQSKRAVEPYKR